MKETVCDVDDLSPGEMMPAKLGPLPVVVIRSQDGSLHAMINSCLHHGARLSEGVLLSRVVGDGPGVYREEVDAEVLRCPWHGYQYDIRTGCTLFDSTRRIQTFKVSEVDGKIVVEN